MDGIEDIERPNQWNNFDLEFKQMFFSQTHFIGFKYLPIKIRQ